MESGEKRILFVLWIVWFSIYSFLEHFFILNTKHKGSEGKNTEIIRSKIET